MLNTNTMDQFACVFECFKCCTCFLIYFPIVDSRTVSTSINAMTTQRTQRPQRLCVQIILIGAVKDGEREKGAIFYYIMVGRCGEGLYAPQP